MSGRVGLAGLAVAAAALVLVGGVSAGLPSPPVAAASPSYSPDGSQVAYAVHHDGGPRGRLVVGSASGGGLRSVYSSTDSCCSSIAWANSQRIVFVDDYQLKSVDMHSGTVRRLASGAVYFYFSPNRQTVAVAEGCECNHAPDAVALVGVDGRGYRLVPEPKDATDELDGFSPDGTQLVFSRYPYSYDSPRTSEPALYAVSVRGGAPVPLARSGLIGSSHLPAGVDHIAWSHDGRWLSYSTPRGLSLLDTATGRSRLVAPGHGPGMAVPGEAAWSPATDELAYVGSYPSGKRTTAGPRWIERLTVVTPQGAPRQLWRSSLTYLTDNPGDLPQWAPNGRSLIFLARPLASRAGARVWVASTDGHGVHQIG